MPKIIVNKIHINYEILGQGPDIVMIHGIATSIAFWYFTAAQSLKNDFRVMVYDLRGHGRSETTESGYTSADMASDLDVLFNQLDIHKAHIIGHSFGGLIALHYAALHPERVNKIVIADTGIPAIEPERKKRPIHTGLIDFLKQSGVEIEEGKENDIDYLVDQIEKINIRKKFKMLRFNSGLPFRQLKHLAKNTTLLNDFREVAGLTLEKIQNIKHPILGIYGENSPSIDTCHYLTKNIKNCRTIIIPDAGHSHPIDLPDFFADNVKEFLKI